jgi:hypothetical protein
MVELIKSRFKVEYERMASSSYLILNMDSCEEIASHIVHIMQDDPSKYILSIDARQKNDTISLYYDITSKVSLSTVIDKKISTENFVKLIRCIIKGILESTRYLMTDRNFILLPEHIYVNLSNYDAAVVYVPVKKAIYNDVNEEFKIFLRELINNKLILEDSSLIGELIANLRKENFDLTEFDTFLANINLSGNRVADEVKTKEREPNNEPVHGGPIKVNNTPDTGNVPKVDPEKADNGRKNSKNPKGNTSTKQDNIAPKKSNESSKLIMILLQVLVIIAVLAVWQIQNSSGSVDYSIITAVAIIAGGVDFIIVRRLLKNKDIKKNIDQVSKKPNVIENDIKDKGGKKVNISKYEMTNTSQKYQYNDNYKNEGDTNPKTGILGTNNNSETTILSDAKTIEKPFLIKNKDGVSEKIEINKNKFIIGKLHKQVDFCIESNFISRVHAEITFKDNKFYIKDLNSKNCTEINNKVLTSNIEYEIRNDDKIKFANEEYTFKIIDV